MFRRVITESWHDWAPCVAFALTFTIFTVAFIRALLMRRESVQRIALLPLDDENPAAARETPIQKIP